MLLIGAASINAQAQAQKIKRSVDDFSDKVTIYTTKDYHSPVSIRKIIEKDEVRYYLDIYTIGYSCVVDGTNMVILFEDGTKMTKDCKVKCSVTSGGNYAYSSFIRLTDDDLKILSTKPISKYKLYVFDRELNSRKSEKIRKNIETVITMN